MAAEKCFLVFGEPVEILVSGATSGGAFNVVTQTCAPGGGPPPHMHLHEDEFFMTQSGQFEILGGGIWHQLPPEGMYAPRGQVHAFRNCGGGDGTIVIVVSPGNIDVFLERISRLKVPEQMAEVVNVSAEYGITYEGL